MDFAFCICYDNIRKKIITGFRREKNAMTKDLTKGSILKCILSFTIPILLGALFQQVYNVVDTAIVGRYLGVNQLAGVGSAGAVFFLMVAPVMGLCNGFSIPVAQRFGAGEERELRRYVANTAWLCIAIAAFLVIATMALCRPLLRLVNTPEEAFGYAFRYLIVIFAGIPFTFLYNMTSGIMRSLGNSRTPVFFLILSSILNVFLDLLFIIAFDMGTAGAAFATVLSQAASGAACFLSLRRYPVLKMREDEKKADLPVMKELSRFGFPMMLNLFITAIGAMFVQWAVNGFGTAVAAGVASGQKIHGVLGCPMDALGQTMASYTGQNTGARRMDRVRKGMTTALLLCAGWWLLSNLVIRAGGNSLVGLFINLEEADATASALRFVTVTVSANILYGAILTLRSALLGLGYPGISVICGVVEMIGRTFVAVYLSQRFGFAGLCYIHIAAWILAALLLLPGFILLLKRKTAELAALTEP